MRFAPFVICILLGILVRLIWDAFGDLANALRADKRYQ